VHISKLLDLERTLKARGVVEAAAHDQQRLLVEKLLGQLEDLVVALEHALHVAGQLLQAFDDLLAPLLLGERVLGHDQGEHDERDELGGVGLGGGDADLGAGVDVDAAVGLA